MFRPVKIIPVSYTHLDVYKRQAALLAVDVLVRKVQPAGESCFTVHDGDLAVVAVVEHFIVRDMQRKIDVYKRQLSQRIKEAPIRQDWPYEEPDDLESVMAACDPCLLYTSPHQGVSPFRGTGSFEMFPQQRGCSSQRL